MRKKNTTQNILLVITLLFVLPLHAQGLFSGGTTFILDGMFSSFKEEVSTGSGTSVEGLSFRSNIQLQFGAKDGHRFGLMYQYETPYEEFTESIIGGSWAYGFDKFIEVGFGLLNRELPYDTEEGYAFMLKPGLSYPISTGAGAFRVSLPIIYKDLSDNDKTILQYVPYLGFSYAM